MSGPIVVALCVAAALPAAADGSPRMTPAGASSSANVSRPHPAVVRVVVPERGGTSLGSGTLVDVHGDYGLVVTNWHVVANAAAAPSVIFADGFRSAAVVVKTDRDWDLAALAIWRPGVEPVPVSDQPPRPGEWLTIAGYGGGPYRAAGGQCTQYVSPGRRFPPEMVEVATAARQGDSGGPIFNQSGQLAGVLFGAGQGRTAGSYSGRVRGFLQSVLPEGGLREGGPSDLGLPAGSLASATGTSQQAVQPSSSATWLSSRGGRSDTERADQVAAAPVQPPARGRSWPHFEDSSSGFQSSAGVGAERSAAAGSGWPALAAIADPGTADPGIADPGIAAAQCESLTWPDLAGQTRGEQLKTILSALGAIALLVHVRRRVLNAR
ncbi:MAG: serine protease [Pirellulales bacterium]